MSSKIPQPKVKAPEVSKKIASNPAVKPPVKAQAPKVKSAELKAEIKNIEKIEATVAEKSELKIELKEEKKELQAELKVVENAPSELKIVEDAPSELKVVENNADDEMYPYARIRHYLDAIGVNKLINEKSLQYKPILQKYKQCIAELEKGRLNNKKELVPLTQEENDDTKKFIEENKSKIESIVAEKIELKMQKLRFSDSSIKYMFKVIQKIISHLLNAAADKAILAQKSIVHPKFLFDDDLQITKFELYPLICELPSCKKLMSEFESEKLENLKEKQFKDGYDKCMKEHKIKREAKKAQAQAQNQAQAQTTVTDAVVIAESIIKQKKEKEYRGFETFIGTMGQALKEKHDKKLKFSKKLKTFISNLIVELLQKVSEVIEIIIGILKVKTINDHIVETILETLMLSHVSLKYEYETKEIITKINTKELEKKAKDDDKRKSNPDRKEYKLKGQIKEGIKINVYEKKILAPVLAFTA